MSSLLNLLKVTKTGRMLGKPGSFGQAIEVRDPRSNTLYAAKEIHPILIDNVDKQQFESVKTSFLKECTRSSLLSHPNVVQTLGVCYPIPDTKLPWMVMELMEKSVTELVESNVTVDTDKKLSILVDVSQGLEYLHNNDIIHRDLSSNNVLLTKHLVAKIADFGVAKLIIEHRTMSRSQSLTQAPGTLHFMAPEALSTSPRYGKPLDVFSFACVTLHLLANKWPTPKDLTYTDHRTQQLMGYTEVERREEYLEMCAPEILKILVKSCLQNDADKRVNITMVCKILKVIRDLITKQNDQIESLVDELVNQLNLGRNEVNKGYGYLTLVNSDFYKAIGQVELRQLQMKLEELDGKASSIEVDLRTAMEQGDKKQEEKLMREWFQLLNEKNNIIRRQVELNLRQKLDDLERKECLLRGELRVLYEDTNANEQRDREEELLQDLMKTVQERNRIEQRKMKTEAQKELEAAGFAKAQNESANVVQSDPSSNPNNSNCVIS